MKVLVAEPSVPIANAIKKFLDGVAEVRVAHFLDEAVDALLVQPYEVVIASASSSFDGEALTTQVRRRAPGSSVLLVFPAEDVEAAAGRAQAAHADGFLVAPLKRHSVVGAVRLAGKVAALTARATGAEAQLTTMSSLLAEARTRLEELGRRTDAQEAELDRRRPRKLLVPDDAFFKKYMLLEVKRSKRYRYPVAVLVVGLDDVDGTLGPVAVTEVMREALHAQALAAIQALLRDIDIALPFAGDRFLVFLPHTPRSGAMVVAARLVDQLRGLPAFPGGTASVGVACHEPGTGPADTSVSFGGLVREATTLLRRAQEAGPARVEGAAAAEAPRPRKNRISLG